MSDDGLDLPPFLDRRPRRESAIQSCGGVEGHAQPAMRGEASASEESDGAVAAASPQAGVEPGPQEQWMCVVDGNQPCPKTCERQGFCSWSSNAPPASIAESAPLALYDAACRAVAEALTVDEVKEITAHAEAMRAYARQAKNREVEVQAAEIRIRAERRLGELMEAQAGTVGKAKPTGSNQHRVRRKPDAPPSLSEAGIDKNLAHRARTYAAVPEEKFEQLLTDKRERASRSVVLDPDFQAEAEAAARDIEIERDERIALAGAGALEEENAKLMARVEMLDLRIAALAEENGSLKRQVKAWKERAKAAGWTGGARA